VIVTETVAQSFNSDTENDHLEERTIKREPGVFWIDHIGVFHQVKAQKAKAATGLRTGQKLLK